MNFSIKPHEDRIIVRLIETPDKTEAGLHIPETAKGAPKMGIVVAVGAGKACEHCGLPKAIKIELGWMVVFPEQAGYQFEWDEVEYKTLRASDIIHYDPTYPDGNA